MIHVAMPALGSTLENLGLNEDTVRFATGTIALLATDPVACTFHRPLEDQLIAVMESTELKQRGLVTFDEVVAAVNVLSRTLGRLAEHYRAKNVRERAVRVHWLSHGIADYLKVA